MYLDIYSGEDHHEKKKCCITAREFKLSYFLTVSREPVKSFIASWSNKALSPIEDLLP